MQQTNPITPAPSRIVVRPFDKLSADSKLILPDNVATGRNTTGIVIAVHYGPQSVMILEYTPRDEVKLNDVYPVDETEWIKVGDQVVFSAMSGTEIMLLEPTFANKRHTQQYIVLREADVIAKLDHIQTEVTVEPRSM